MRKATFLLFHLIVISVRFQKCCSDDPFHCLSLGNQKSPSIGILLHHYPSQSNDSASGFEEILNVVAKRGFRELSTFVAEDPTSQMQDELVSKFITFNEANSNRTFSVYPGFLTDPTNWKNDMHKMFSAVKQINVGSPGALKGVTIIAEGNHASFFIKDICLRLKKSRQAFPPLGVFELNCLEVVESAVKNNSPGLLKKIGFLMCLKLPNQTNTPESEANDIANYMRSTQHVLDKAKLKIKVIGVTGWRSPFLEVHGFLEARGLLRRFWCEMEKRSVELNLTIHMYYGFENTQLRNTSGEVKAQFPLPGYGWWIPVAKKGTDSLMFVEKVNYKVVPKIPLREIVFGIVVACVIIVVSIILVYLYYKLKVTKELLSSKEFDEFMNGNLASSTDSSYEIEDALKLPYDTSYEIEKSSFHIETATILGKGEFGIVYKGKLEGYEKDVAFKVTSTSTKVTELKKLLSEIKIMIHVGKHPNVVHIIGSHTGEIREGNVFIALELCDFGSLESYLRNFRADIFKKHYISCSDGTQTAKEMITTCSNDYENNRSVAGPTLSDTVPESSPEFILPQLVKWAHEIANGMEHISSKKIIHSDLASRNVLLSSGKTAKISDFGLSRRLYEYTTYTKQNQEPLPWRWMAIESLEQLVFSTKSDVWSYGVTLYEIFSLGLIPYPGLRWTVGFTDEIKTGLLKIPQPEYATSEMYNVMKNCWNINPHCRPDFTALKNLLSELIKDVVPEEYVVLGPNDSKVISST